MLGHDAELATVRADIREVERRLVAIVMEQPAVDRACAQSGDWTASRKLSEEELALGARRVQLQMVLRRLIDATLQPGEHGHYE